MRYHIHHKTSYTYNQPVFLKPHLVRLRPRSNSWQTLDNFFIKITPQPVGISEINDLDGNSLQKIWFTAPTEQFALEIESEIETHIDNPFNFLLEPWALKLPMDYPNSLFHQLQSYLRPYSAIPDAIALALAQDILHQEKQDTLAFLNALNQHIYKNCSYVVRETGDPWEAGITWRNKTGSCRDLTVLFMEACRAVGLATRFVSGYQEGDLATDDWELHAWAEVYLPGGGWRGYDPTHGLVVSDRHIALVASANPLYTAPVVGEIVPVSPFMTTGKLVQSAMQTQVVVRLQNAGMSMSQSLKST
ncbi:MAG: transglutaminase [Snowella sp.]|jgi:transglutaminase-like putative cysteine protease|nr:MAG: transglutaminase [Snowella sp.]